MIVGSVRKSNCVEGCRIGILWLVLYMSGNNHLNSVNIPYSGKTWQALNLVISAKMPYFLNLASFKFGSSVPQPKNDVTTTTYATCQLAI